MKTNCPKNNKGFTLIELLVVIAIIGILSTILMANFMGIRERARDATRKADFNQIQKALELYKNTQTPPQYPATLSLLEDPNSDGDFSDALMQQVPDDPLCPAGVCTGFVNYSYTRNSELDYDLVACLENAADQQKDSIKHGNCVSHSASYTRTEP